MTRRRLIIALAALVCGGLAAIALTRDPPTPEIGAELGDDCTTCDARAASKKRAREALQQNRDAAE